MTEYIVDVKEMIEKLGYEVPMVLDKNGKIICPQCSIIICLESKRRGELS